MYKFYPILNNFFLGLEFISALVAFIYLFKLRKTYWKWFSLYLIFIFCQEFFWKFTPFDVPIRKQDYYAFIGIPIQYLFFYWLYALKSLEKKKLFFLCASIYLITFIPMEIFKEEIKTLSSINLTLGSILLMFLIVLEFLKQIRNDNILMFKTNKMFYINAGVIIFYIGTYPFSAFYNQLLEHPNIWNKYYLSMNNIYVDYGLSCCCFIYINNSTF